MITLDSELTTTGTVYSHPALGTVATILRNTGRMINGNNGVWWVRPYSFATTTHAASFMSFRAAEAYALALAYEMHETGFGI